MAVYDPIESPLSSYQDKTDKLKLVPRAVVLVLAVSYLITVWTGANAMTVYYSGLFLSVMTIAYIIGVDSLKDIIDAVVKTKGVNITLPTPNPDTKDGE